MTDIQSTIAAERTDLVAVLRNLSAADWDRPTLCEGWRVRELVAHIVMPYRYSTPRFLLGMLKSRRNFNRLANRQAAADAAALAADELTKTLEDNIHHQWKPPGGGYEGALSHDVIHGLDLTVALGIDRHVPLDRLAVVLAGAGEKQLKYSGVDLTGTRLQATDLDWSLGTGEVEEDTAENLLLRISGRRLPG
ncbi:maleylpyruvate isomerase family mycothiol-dependent enzyme [Kribbella sp. NPDC051770]|uniref:maleylpyruvate isomerase family mycothiol-dependent enzyme n=1 Tax=Kribbella sp. NPDC051770 TaxID=3155413 RepID=UPI003422A34B